MPLAEKIIASDNCPKATPLEDSGIMTFESLRPMLSTTLIGGCILGAALYLGSGTHALRKPAALRPYTPPPEYEWRNDESPCSEAYVRPAVERYLSSTPRGARVLDLGCGNGAMAGSFLGKGWDLVGVDISQSGIEYARKRWPQIRFEVGDATGDLSMLGQFDALYSTEVIEHIVLPRRFAQNCYRLLKPGGRLVLSTPYHGWLKNVAIAFAGDADTHYQPLIDWGHIKFWSANTLSRLLWDAGFESVEYSGTGRVPYLWKSIVMTARKPQ
jgi:2-polyprenyl-6-hydroxyphenyl methylase/3-demethylubiquinone-9 3-methyltransferase